MLVNDGSRPFTKRNNNFLPNSNGLPDAHPRGVKRQAVDNLEHERVDLLIQSMIRRFTEVDVSGNPALRHLTPEKQHQLIDGLVHNLSSYQDELHAVKAVTDSGPLHSPPRR